MRHYLGKPGRVWLFGLLWLLVSSCHSANSIATVPGTSGKPSLAPILEKVLPTVANVSTTSKIRVEQNPLLKDPFFRHFFNIPEMQQMPKEMERQSLGSAVVVDAGKGYLVTNFHVVEHADQVVVSLRDRRRFKAKVVGSDQPSDLALIQIKADNLTAIPFGDSDSLRVGDYVIAIGSPFGLSQTVTSGIVSALGRSGLGIEGYENFIQTDASINPGNSGGPLVDLDGHLVGINTAIVGSNGGNVGIGFAIPSNIVRKVMEQLEEYGEVKRGQLGVGVQDLTPELAKALHLENSGGAVITQIMKGSAAEKAGLHVGDVVVAVDDKPVVSAGDLRIAIGMMRIGAEVKLSILRDGKPMTVSAAIGKARHEEEKAAEISDRLAGAKLGSIQPDNPLAGQVEGVEVLQVESGSPAAFAGLQEGDIIVSVNREPVRSLEELRKAIKAAKGELLLNVRRGDSALFIVIQ